jgi:L-asparagine transporter-like permease
MKEKLQHKLQNRHIQMIALGGIIGTGFFVGSAGSIKYTGASLVLAYMLGGLIMYCIMRILGEMTVYAPNSGSFVDYAYHFLGKPWGFITGWNSWVLFTLSCMLEATATAYLLDYWFIIPHWVSCLIILLIFTGINLLNVKYFAELEFWFAGIKIVFITMIILAGLYLMFFHAGVHKIMLNNLAIYQSPKQLFTNGPIGFIQALAMACLSLCGAEFVSVAAGEADNPKQSIPLAINGVVTKIVFFYTVTTAIILLIYPYSYINYKVSPFIEVFIKLGFNYSAVMINIITIVATLSALNSVLYVSSRFLYKLALNNQAPIFLSVTNAQQIPANAILFTAICALISVFANYFCKEHLLDYLFAIILIAILLNWFIIISTHFFFRKYIKKTKTVLEYTSFGFPILNLCLLLILTIILVVVIINMPIKYGCIVPIVWLLFLYLYYLTYNLISNK